MSMAMSFHNAQEAESSSSSSQSLQPCRQFMFSEIWLATQNFDESLVIGRGGFGKVYKGTISDGASSLVVAIKRLDSTSNQGEVEFWAEVKMLTKLRHRQLVSLIGYCSDGQEMILVYEYMPNGTLEDHLHKRPTRLPWVRRLKICFGAARGLEYLHADTGIKHRVIHRDVKSSNILLHYNWEAKISDFGLSKISTNQTSSYVNTLVKGTFGYIDPDYFATGRLTRKSDVYAFGVVLFEVLCGKRAVDRSLDEEQWGLAGWAQDSINEGRLKQIVDSNIRDKISPKCLKDFARLAKRCLHSHPKQRPTMAEVVVSLEYILALQGKINKALNDLNPAGMTIFGRKVPMFLSPSNAKNSVGGKSLKSLELYFDNVGGESKTLYQFDFETIRVATENFSEANKIVPREWDSMYKGRLQNGQGIAIAEPYFEQDRQGTTIAEPHSDPAFQRYINQVSLLVNLQHENLAQLLGYCIEGGRRVFLVYDFAPYASLYNLIFDAECTLLDWNKRYKIILGVARVLLYLRKHAPMRIIHLDNILVDESLEPKLSSFEMARCRKINEIEPVKVEKCFGTIGYRVPEGFCRSLSNDCDVFSFGEMLLATISGNMRIGDSMFTVLTNWMEGTFSNIIDHKIIADSCSIKRFIHIGLLCVQVGSKCPTMEEVVGMLVGNSSLPRLFPEKELSLMCSWIIDCNSDYDESAEEEFMSELCPR